jgi:hypothetical protein
MVVSRDGHEGDVEKPITEVTGWDPRGHYDIRSSIDYRFLRARQHCVRYLHLRVRTKALKLRDDIQKAIARKSGVHNESEFRLPPLAQRAGQFLDSAQIIYQRASPLEQHLAMGREDGLSPFDGKQRDVECLLKTRHCVADG